MKKDNVMFIIVFVVLIGLICLFYYFHGENEKEYAFQVYFFDAGKADAIVLSRNDHYIMIDTGESSLSGEILQFFKNHHISKLDYLIITHFDKDHIGSAHRILKEIEIGEVLQSNVPKDNDAYKKYVDALYQKDITPTTVTGNRSISFQNMPIIINGPDREYDNKKSNNSSLIVSVKDGDNSFLFTGDIENERIKDFLSTDIDTYKFLKVPYHGHYLKQLDSLLKASKPEISVITSSDEEVEDVETLTLLEQYKVKTYLTRKGSIVILSNGKDLIVKQ